MDILPELVSAAAPSTSACGTYFGYFFDGHYQPRYFLVELLVFGLILLTLASNLQAYSGKAVPAWVKPGLLIVAVAIARGAYGHRLLLSDYAYQHTSIIRGAELSLQEERVLP